MAKRNQFSMSSEERRLRHFSVSFKTEKIKEIQQGKTKVSEICKEYEVSASNVYRWIEKYGQMKKKKIRMVVETESDTKKILLLKQRIAELEQIIGQKQVPNRV
ncbi:MAG: transposase [Bacteroidales bacterium]|nr:transposase [Bacteroidales bacterium]